MIIENKKPFLNSFSIYKQEIIIKSSALLGSTNRCNHSKINKKNNKKLLTSFSCYDIIKIVKGKVLRTAQGEEQTHDKENKEKSSKDYNNSINCNDDDNIIRNSIIH